MLDHLRAAVKESGVTQAEIAAKLDKTETYVSKVLRGTQALTLIEIRNICGAAGIPFVQWVGRLDVALDRKDRA